MIDKMKRFHSAAGAFFHNRSQQCWNPVLSRLEPQEMNPVVPVRKLGLRTVKVAFAAALFLFAVFVTFSLPKGNPEAPLDSGMEGNMLADSAVKPESNGDENAVNLFGGLEETSNMWLIPCLPFIVEYQNKVYFLDTWSCFAEDELVKGHELNRNDSFVFLGEDGKDDTLYCREVPSGEDRFLLKGTYRYIMDQVFTINNNQYQLVRSDGYDFALYKIGEPAPFQEKDAMYQNGEYGIRWLAGFYFRPNYTEYYELIETLPSGADIYQIKGVPAEAALILKYHNFLYYVFRADGSEKTPLDVWDDLDGIGHIAN